MRCLLCVLLFLVPAAEAEESEWLRASPRYEMQFPRDHYSHPDYGLEWWYYTGNLEAANGERFGYQLTFFRVGIRRPEPTHSAWAVGQLYLAHAAVSEIDAKRFRYGERMNRPGLGDAGASQTELHVWNGEWSLKGSGESHVLRVSDEAFSFVLTLDASQKPVLHGKNGYSQKGRDEGNASHYYSFPRMQTKGELRLGERVVQVRGLSWMDHEYGTSFLEEGQQGWDWFALQLNDGRNLMLYQFRDQDGSKGSFSRGTLMDGENVRHFKAEDFKLTPVRSWKSPDSGATYPVEWDVSVPSLPFTARVLGAFDSQELQTEATTGVTYWEGAVRVLSDDREIGRGYLEMTGYASEPISSALSSE